MSVVVLSHCPMGDVVVILKVWFFKLIIRHCRRGTHCGITLMWMQKNQKKTPHNENATLVMAWCHPDLCHNMRLIGHNELSGTQNIIIIIVCKHHINVFQNIATDVKKSTAKVITVICLLARQQEAWYQLKWKGYHSDSLITAGSCQVISLKRNHHQQKLSPWWPVYFSVDSVQ